MKEIIPYIMPFFLVNESCKCQDEIDIYILDINNRWSR